MRRAAKHPRQRTNPVLSQALLRQGVRPPATGEIASEEEEERKCVLKPMEICRLLEDLKKRKVER